MNIVRDPAKTLTHAFLGWVTHTLLTACSTVSATIVCSAAACSYVYFPQVEKFGIFTGFSVTKLEPYEYIGMNPEYYTGLHRPYYAETAMCEDIAGELQPLSLLCCFLKLMSRYGLDSACLFACLQQQP